MAAGLQIHVTYPQYLERDDGNLRAQVNDEY